MIESVVSRPILTVGLERDEQRDIRQCKYCIVSNYMYR